MNEEMLSGFLRIYAAIHFVFFLFAVTLLRRFSADIATKLEYNAFRFLIRVYLAYLTLSVTCTFVEYGTAVLPHALVWAIWLGTIFSAVLIALSLYMFAVLRYAPHLTKWRWFTPLTLTPIFVIAAMLLFSIKNGMVIRITPDDRAVYGPFYWVLSVVMILYFAAIVTFVFHQYEKSRSYVKRAQLRALISSVLFICVSGAMDLIFARDHLSILPTATLASIISLYISMQESGIYTDTLTGMNNRRKTSEYLGAQLEELSEASPVYLYMCDVNSFKKINDEHGHAEGDRALICVAETLKAAAAKYNGFAARLGGDEFLFAWFPRGQGADAHGSPEEIISEVESSLAARCAAEKKPYALTVSLGYTRCADPRKPLSEYIREADEMLYARKRAFHKKNAG